LATTSVTINQNNGSNNEKTVRGITLPLRISRESGGGQCRRYCRSERKRSAYRSLSLAILHGGFLSLSFPFWRTRFSRIHQETAAFNLQLRMGHRPFNGMWYLRGPARVRHEAFLTRAIVAGKIAATRARRSATADLQRAPPGNSFVF
jgi:hypothetical protein